MIGLTVVVSGLNSRIDQVEETLESLTLDGIGMATRAVGVEPAQEIQTITVPRATTQAPRPTATAAPTDTENQSAEHEPDATPTSMPTKALATVPGEGICGRSPHVQQAILSTLQSNSCRMVTSEELYRITWLSDLRSHQVDTTSWKLQAGDLSGLVNLVERTFGSNMDLPSPPPPPLSSCRHFPRSRKSRKNICAL